MRTISTYRKSGRLFILRVMGMFRQLETKIRFRVAGFSAKSSSYLDLFNSSTGLPCGV
jgi:hypothetical protein